MHQHFPLGYLKSDKATYCTAESWSTLTGLTGMFPVPVFTAKALELGDTNLSYVILLTQLLLLLLILQIMKTLSVCYGFNTLGMK